MEDPLPLARDLIRRRSVTPADDGAIGLVAGWLERRGFRCTPLRFGEIENLWATRGEGGPHFCFAGHTDVVPPGDGGWSCDPFAAVERDGLLFGRGAVDMKGAIAAFVAALPERSPGRISLLITGDEEGPARDGTARVVDWLRARDEVPDMALVGEPTSVAVLGDTIKIGRRGSLNAVLRVEGVQGHVAYPDRADNPVHRLIAGLASLLAQPLDAGTAWFPPSSLQVTSIDVGNAATNVIPARATARLNIRFNDLHDAASLEARILRAMDAAGARCVAEFDRSADAFVTRPGPFVEALRRAVRRSTGVEPRLDTGGGTSDARFLAPLCPVAELGPVGTTMHKADECVPVAELRALSALYASVMAECLHGSVAPAGT
ncbi:MAG: succinyl-diaminopimelate desuccinylase [Acetobacteraceae bacterium]|nr:succinyl-diaminopimelate desuccinylase [Acetobacteraceae bacterium]MDW8397992.1 succinyl-diaminopimelate desuccinylase [Acetobacteraceae bacterium]